MGIMPNNFGDLGDIEKVSKVFEINEFYPLQKVLKELNSWIGGEIITLNDYIL